MRKAAAKAKARRDVAEGGCPGEETDQAEHSRRRRPRPGRSAAGPAPRWWREARASVGSDGGTPDRTGRTNPGQRSDREDDGCAISNQTLPVTSTTASTTAVTEAANRRPRGSTTDVLLTDWQAVGKLGRHALKHTVTARANVNARSGNATETAAHAAQVDRAALDELSGEHGTYDGSSERHRCVNDRPTNPKNHARRPGRSPRVSTASRLGGAPAARCTSTASESSTSTVGVRRIPSRRTSSRWDSASTSDVDDPGNDPRAPASICRVARHGAQNDVENCSNVTRSPRTTPNAASSPAMLPGTTGWKRPSRALSTNPNATAPTNAPTNTHSPVTLVPATPTPLVFPSP